MVLYVKRKKKKKRKYRFVSSFIFLISNKSGFLQMRRLLPKAGPGFPNTALKTGYQLLQTLHNKDVWLYKANAPPKVQVPALLPCTC